MKNTKLISLLNSFDRKTITKLDHYFNSPFFKISSELKDFHELIKPNIGKFQQTISKEELYQKIFMGPYKDQKMRLLTSRYYQQIERFLAFQNLDSKSLLMEQLCLEEISRYNKIAIYEEKRAAINKKCEKSETDSALAYHTKLKLEEQTFEFFTRLKRPESITNLQALHDNIDNYFLYLKLKYSCELVARKHILSQDYDLSFLQSLLTYIESNKVKFEPLILAYYQTIILIQKNDEQSYYALKDFINIQTKAFTKRDLRDLYVFMTNFCIQQSNLGKAAFRKELFEIYKFLLKEKIIIEGKYLHLYDYKNIATAALQLGEMRWLEEFTEQFSDYLSPKFRKSAKAYNLARIAFNNNALKNALRILNEVDYADLYYELGFRVLKLKIFYERSDFEIFLADIKSFKLFLKRSKLVSKYQKQLYFEFLKWALFLFHFSNGQKKVSDFYEVLINTSTLPDKSWIKEKMDELQ
ncbi:MAG: hypothetical protein MRY83_09710 [Flavobacteriales bacterium]|nr:hypothetical protein [Flavobacteriales bacterium]